MLKRIQSKAAIPTISITSAQEGFGSGGEVGILRRELQKRKGIKPLRRLFSEIPRVLQAIKPCMLMSPVSVSTFLKPGALNFDLVVFDEASQLPAQEAIPSILRAKQVVVAGDENQLPPTSFSWHPPFLKRRMNLNLPMSLHHWNPYWMTALPFSLFSRMPRLFGITEAKMSGL